MLKKSQDAFHTLAEGISEGIVIVNKNQNIITTNASADTLFGYNIGELEGMPLETLIPAKYHTKHEKQVDHFYENSRRRRMAEGHNLFGLRKNGEEFPVEVGLNPLKVGDETYIMALVIDITERVEAQKVIKDLNANLEKKIESRTKELHETVAKLQELNVELGEEIKKRIEAETKIKNALQKEIELNELKTKFLSLVSHEFKTPLSGILTSTVLVGKYKETDQQSKRNKHLKTIVDKVKYLNTILNDFLSIERIDSGKIHYKYTTFLLSKIVNEAIYNANMLLKPGQKINFPNNIDEFIIYQDEKILELILSNLINNAIKYSPNDATINLDFVIMNTFLKITIEDQGIGIPEKDHKHIFERYFRAENALLEQGTGIGLNIIKGHIENLGGNITFTSKVNLGTTFFVELPIIKQ